MRKPAFCIFYGLYILVSFSLLTITARGVSNKHCLLPFFHFQSESSVISLQQFFISIALKFHYIVIKLLPFTEIFL